ncbi:hypothetical protein [Paenibacillus caui]|uniref:hypothetical protein n=1 Tax=Paenibacillus caui TaxID=2873927 RepID=UPI001F1CACBF|nr:hypothetical protein [Paenibacillus caui]
MNFQSNFYLIKHNLIKQMRSYSFLIVIGISMFLGYFCVPSAADGYEVFYIGGVRGIYNSAWLGGMAAMLSTLSLWLFGFYMLRSQISEDQRLKVGQIIASSPISKLRYISGKAISNFVVLIVIELILNMAFMAMQLLRGEDYHLQLWDYAAPFLFIGLPSLFVLAALTVLFDVFPGLKGVLGNLVFFSLWIFFSVISIASPSSVLDLFGLDAIRSDMVQEAAVKYPYIAQSEAGGSFGYYPVEGEIPTFEWQGVRWDFHLLTPRLVWVAIAVILILLSSVLFNRFKTNKDNKSVIKASIYDTNKKRPAPLEQKGLLELSPVKKEKGVRLFRLIKAELRVMLKGLTVWWYLLAGGLAGCSFFVPLDTVRAWLPVMMVLPIAIWSQMGTREKHYFTRELVLSSCPRLVKWFAVWVAGIVVTLLFSLGAIVQFALHAQWSSVYSWGVGVFFIPTLALTLGVMSGSRKLFEVIYMLWWYLGPFNDIPYLDFLGISKSYAGLYIALTFILIAASTAVQIMQSGHLSIKRRVSR